MAGPFTRADFEKLVPADKKLSPAWLAALTARGTPEVYRGAELDKIGMPVGGIGAGQVYLGGDGRLWHWDIFNRHVDSGSSGPHYARPMTPTSPFELGFALRVTATGRTDARPLDRRGWRDITFRGAYPLGRVEYRDPAVPVEVSLEAFSPFLPLNVEDSTLPVIVLGFTVKNAGAVPAEVELAGGLANPVCLFSGRERPVQRRNRVVRRPGLLAVECSAADLPPEPPAAARPDILFDDFERPDHGDWTVTGTAFGRGPVRQAEVPDYQGPLGLHGERAVNSHAAAPAGDVAARDAHQGTLTSRPFTIERDFITFPVGGGAHPGKTCVNLLVDGQVVLSTPGRNDNRLGPVTWNVRAWAGRTARLQSVDLESGGWGNIGLDHILFTDRPSTVSGPLAHAADFGTMTLVLLSAGGRSPAPETHSGPADPARAGTDWASAAFPAGPWPEGLFQRSGPPTATATASAEARLVGGVGRRLTLAPGETHEVTFLVTWHFPNLTLPGVLETASRRARGLSGQGRVYASRFGSALEVAETVAAHFPRLAGETRLGHDTWYDSTLPYWFLDRTFLNTSILATSTCHLFEDGRFWAWEGVGCCPGTCGHVWQYAQAPARLFPELERRVRERTDFGPALQPDGAIYFRGEHNQHPAVDAQAGTVLRALREHQMCPDATWLNRLWPAIRRATRWLIAQDGDGDGLLTGRQHNTLDTDWFGPVAWLSGLYLAALRAAAEMAEVVGDTAFAAQCRDLAERGQRKLVAGLFNGEYFINQPDPARPEAINSGSGCHIDQVLGQSWAFQVGLPRVLPEAETRAALRALWRYHFTPDVGPYRAAYPAGRWYALPGEAGLLMCTFPRTDWDYAQARGRGPDWAAGYFNECMCGFEYQVAAHMLWEGLVTEGLAITRAIHDRYHPSRRNPWNEIECGDHYARSLASYGVFLAACGYAYDGPRGALAFAPRLSPAHFRAAFTAAEGWGRVDWNCHDRDAVCELDLRRGRLRLRQLTLSPLPALTPQRVRAAVADQSVPATLSLAGDRAVVRFEPGLVLLAGQRLRVELR